MGEIKYIGVFLFLLSLLLGCERVSTFQIIDYTPPYLRNVYSLGLTPQCIASYYLVLEDPNGIEYGGGANIVADGTQLLERNTTHALYKMVFSFGSSSGSVPIQLRNSLGDSQNINLNYTCKQPPTNPNIQLIGSPYFPFAKGDMPVFRFKTTGLDPLYRPISFAFRDSTLALLGETTGYSSNDFIATVNILPNGFNWDSLKADTPVYIYYNQFSSTPSYGTNTLPALLPTGTNQINSKNQQISSIQRDGYFLSIQTCLNNDDLVFQTGYLTAGGSSMIPTLMQGNYLSPTFFQYFYSVTSSSYNQIYFNPSAVYSSFAYPYDINFINLAISSTPSLSRVGDLILRYFTTENLGSRVHWYSLRVQANGTSTYLPYPFGYQLSYSTTYSKQFEFLFSPYTNKVVRARGDSPSYILTSTTPDTLPPFIKSATVSLLPQSTNRLFRLNIGDDISGFYEISNMGNFTAKTSGSNLDGVYDFIVTQYDYIRLSNNSLLCDFARNCRQLNLFEPFNLNGDYINQDILKLSDINSISFDKNDIDISNSHVSNKLFIVTKPGTSKALPVVMVMVKEGLSIDTTTMIFNGQWDETEGCYVVPFNVHQNYITGVYPYYLYIDNKPVPYSHLKLFFGETASLRIKSNNGDIMGPIINQFSVSTVNQGSTKTLTLNIGIVDKVNGFKKGIISLITAYDLVEHNKTFTSDDKQGGDIYQSTYAINYSFTLNCRSQNINISYIELEDQQGHVSIFNFFQQPPNVINPIMSVPKPALTLVCSGPAENITPTLTAFSFTPTLISPFSVSSRTVVFNFQSSDSSGINLASVPFIYLHDYSMQIKGFPSTLIDSNETSANYTAVVEVPYGFGDERGLSVSVYGIVDVYSNFRGYSNSIMPFPNNISVSPSGSNDQIIFSTSSLSVRGGSLTIYGKNFNLPNTDVQISFSNSSIYQNVSPTTIEPNILIVNVNALNEPFIFVTIRQLSTQYVYSNSYKVVLESIETDSSSSSGGMSSSSNENTDSSGSQPTPPPNPCKNNCGGDNGICTLKGCQCYYPWTGAECSSQIIIVVPTINTTKPDTSIDSKGDNGVFNSVISLVALNELGSKGELIYQYKFQSWIVTPNENSVYKQFSPVSYKYETNITHPLYETVSYINVFIDFFNQSEPVAISFANEILTMNPSSLKYSVNITTYSFSSSLNTLQLVMATSIESKDTQCSAQETGNTVDNSEFIKLQVDNHSLYGRFIKRGIIDGRVRAVTNNLLLNSDLYLSNSTTSKSSAFIGINIPQFSRLVQIDPDFSVLIDNKAANADSLNSICSEKKSKLSNAQLAGIIVGSVAFGTAIIACIIYCIVKKRKDVKFMNKLKLKFIASK
ncbi:hypothetical protein CYY_002830 [Polysphondylium violaceum]|uniref:EGF-like domain-containing protein n=1 Tax=Polysphondylium violaceum TaxID=133409 RepID=A0A8J4PZG8_9MYCE|nr:hypothetical protein CYY_002830 [Polysphondylium violaceum]